MSTTVTDHEVHRLRREVADLRRDLQTMKSDLMWKESGQRFNRQVALLCIVIVVLYAAMGALLALITVAISH